MDLLLPPLGEVGMGLPGKVTPQAPTPTLPQRGRE